MLSRALSSATVTLLIGCFAAIPVQAQNLEAGKSPSQIFAGGCAACHKSPRGLLKTVPAGSLPGFLRQHYTTSSEMASLLSAFLISNGAADTRYVGSQPKPDKDAKSEARPAGPPEQLDRQGRRLRTAAPSQEPTKPDAEPRQAAKPDADGLPSQAEPGHKGRNARRLARPVEAPDATKPVEGQAPAEASERGPEGRKSAARRRLGKRGKPGAEEPPKADAAKTDAAKTDAAKTDAAKTDAAKDEPSKGEPAKEDKPTSETAKGEGSKPEGAKPSGEGESEAAKIEAPAKIDAPKETGSGETPALRADPVPPVTPAPKSAEGDARPVQTATPAPSSRPEASRPASAATPEPTAPPPAVTASPPPPAPVAPAGPPIPPISQ
jgi:hypothetical protein